MIVEKEAVFSRLVRHQLPMHAVAAHGHPALHQVEDGFCELEPYSILVTAKGMPDVATRLLCSELCRQHPHLQTFCGRSLLQCICAHRL